MSGKSNEHDLVQLARTLEPIGTGSLQAVRIDENDETIVVPFTKTSRSVELHYCREIDLQGFVPCNGPDCLLCQINRKKETRYLLPVYSPDVQAVAVLPVSSSQRPQALLPQLVEILAQAKPVFVFIRRSGYKFTVSSSPIERGMDDGLAAIAAFQKQYEAGAVTLESVFPAKSNEQLGMVPEIANRLRIKGLKT